MSLRQTSNTVWTIDSPRTATYEWSRRWGIGTPPSATMIREHRHPQISSTTWRETRPPLTSAGNEPARATCVNDSSLQACTVTETEVCHKQTTHGSEERRPPLFLPWINIDTSYEESFCRRGRQTCPPSSAKTVYGCCKPNNRYGMSLFELLSPLRKACETTA